MEEEICRTDGFDTSRRIRANAMDFTWFGFLLADEVPPVEIENLATKHNATLLAL